MRNEKGQLLPLALGLLMVSLAVVGLATDMTRLLLARRSLQSVADASSLRAATQLNEGAMYASYGTKVDIVPARARDAALQTIALRGLRAESSVSVEGGRVTVSMRGVVDTTLLRLVGIETLPVAVTSTGIPVEGVP
jgi:Flp pilus assembly protein TadG